MATETGEVEDAFWFAEQVVAAAANDVDDDDLPQPSELIRQRDAAIIQPFLDALREHHGCQHDMRETKGSGIMEPCGRIGSWSQGNWDSNDSWYCDEHVNEARQYGPVERSESITRALLAQEKADG